MGNTKEIIDNQTLLARFKRFGLKVSIEELNKIPEDFQKQLYYDLGYLHKRLFDEVAVKKKFATTLIALSPSRSAYVIVKNNRITVFVRDTAKKTITQYLTIKELDRFSKHDRQTLNELLAFDEIKDRELFQEATKINKYIHILINENVTRGSPKCEHEYTTDEDFEYDIPNQDEIE